MIDMIQYASSTLRFLSVSLLLLLRYAKTPNTLPHTARTLNNGKTILVGAVDFLLAKGEWTEVDCGVIWDRDLLESRRRLNN